ncbi:MAG: 3-hydroxyacyl-CoA dehydrogenase family protein [Opitutus sp.]|nr:3-hydroxyacyl-CoA dehydrogenase family protein [Opitutus sp.]
MDSIKTSADSKKTVAVLGLGTMGHGIAQTFAAAGYAVRCFDEHPAARGTTPARVRSNLHTFVQAGLLPPDRVEPIVARITVCDTEAEAVSEAFFVTEAVKEDLAVKRELFARLESLISPDAILASNSSTLPISQSGARLKYPGRAIVTHWFNPPHLVPLVEVVPGPKTDEVTTQTAMEVMKEIGKQPVRLRKEIPGFLVNRIQVAVMREVWDMLEREVASADDIDTAVRASIGFRLAAIGPLEVHDFGGLDIQTTVFRNLAPEIRSSLDLPAVVRALVEQGHLGTKTGRGFHEYPPKRLAERQARRDSLFLELVKLLYPDSVKGTL